jgi:hypothetical protein
MKSNYKGVMMKIQLIGVLSLLVVMNGAAYERRKLAPGERAVKQPQDPKQKQTAPTYYTDDGQYAVYLTLEERRIIERILKPHTWSDQDYRQTIDDKFIKIYTGGCCCQCDGKTCIDVSQCTACSEDAKLFIEVMHDFKGKNVEILFSQLNLRREL